VKAFNTALFPINIYSKKIKPGQPIPDGAKIGIPNDPTNGGRSLLLLANHGLIKVKDPRISARLFRILRKIRIISRLLSWKLQLFPGAWMIWTVQPLIRLMP
jgi:ABC-type metal ion transport system substrate-binding protein